METRSNTEPTPLMRCRYCLLHEMGHCRRVSPMHPEPHYLRLANGTILRLEFDCRHCEMLIWQDANRQG